MGPAVTRIELSIGYTRLLELRFGSPNIWSQAVYTVMSELVCYQGVERPIHQFVRITCDDQPWRRRGPEGWASPGPTSGIPGQPLTKVSTMLARKYITLGILKKIPAIAPQECS